MCLFGLSLFKPWTCHWLCDAGFAVDYWVSVAALDLNLEFAMNLYRLLVIQVLVKCRLCLQTFLYFLNLYFKVPTNGYLFPEANLLCSVQSNLLSDTAFPWCFVCTCYSTYSSTYEVLLSYLCILSTRLLAPFSVSQSTMVYIYLMGNKCCQILLSTPDL